MIYSNVPTNAKRNRKSHMKRDDPKRPLVLMGLICLLTLFVGCDTETGNQESSDRNASQLVVAKVGDRVITLADLDREMKNYRFFVSTKGGADKNGQVSQLRHGLLGRLINHVILETEADAQGIVVTKSDLENEIRALLGNYDEARIGLVLAENGLTLDEWKGALARRIKIRKLTIKAVDDAVETDEEEIRDYFERNREDFRWPERVHAQQIMTVDETTAEQVRRKLLGGGDFSDLARAFSKSPEAASGGDLGYFSAGQLPPRPGGGGLRLETGSNIRSDQIDLRISYLPSDRSCKTARHDLRGGQRAGAGDPDRPEARRGVQQMGRKPVEEIRNQRLSRSLVVLLLILVAGTSVGTVGLARAEVVERTVANVNGEIILLSDIRERIEMRQQFGDTEGSYGREEALEELVEEKLLARYAEENNVVIKESEIDTAVQNIIDKNGLTLEQFREYLTLKGTTEEKYRERMKNQMLIQRITSMEVKRPTVTDDEARAYYEEHKDQFSDPGRVHARHIILMASRDRDPEAFREAWAKMVDIKEEILDGADFASMAERHSQDASAQKGGDLGWFGAGQMIPEFERLAFRLEPGEVGGPLETRFGIHLIQVIDREAPSAESFGKVLEAIRAKMEQEIYKERRQAWVDKIRDQSYIEYMH